MHYIRFLKPPSIIPQQKRQSDYLLSSRVTITTDLGESFLCYDLELVAELRKDYNESVVYDRRTFYWKSGSRHLDIAWHVQCGNGKSAASIGWPCTLTIYCTSQDIHPTNLSNLLLESASEEEWGLSGSVVGVASEPFSIAKSNSTEGRVRRSFGTARDQSVIIWEEIGESIARHVWDAGLILSAHLHELSLPNAHKIPQTPLLKSCLLREKVNVLELGTGCGIIGISLAICFENVEVVITDLPEAKDIATFNLEQNRRHGPGQRIAVTYENLDWTQAVTERQISNDLDLIVAGDVTYNSDMIPDLVKTVASLIGSGTRTRFLVAMKVRHDSEAVFFDLMTQAGLKIVERLTIPMPVLAQDDQAIEIYLFGRVA